MKMENKEMVKVLLEAMCIDPESINVEVEITETPDGAKHFTVKTEEEHHCCGNCEYCNCHEDEEGYDDNYDEDDYDEDDYCDDDEEYVPEPKKYNAVPEVEGVYVLYVKDPYVIPGEITDNPYVGPDYKVALGPTQAAVEEKYADAITMIKAHGLDYAIKAPTVIELNKMMDDAAKYIPNVKAIREASGAFSRMQSAAMMGQEISKEDITVAMEGITAASKLNPDNNYHA